MAFIVPLPDKSQCFRYPIPYAHDSPQLPYLHPPPSVDLAIIDIIVPLKLDNGVLKATIPRHVQLFSKITVGLHWKEALKEARLYKNDAMIQRHRFDFENVNPFSFFKTKAVDNQFSNSEFRIELELVPPVFDVKYIILRTFVR